jgi:two-component system nitrate/nitrite response regulator NarL
MGQERAVLRNITDSRNIGYGFQWTTIPDCMSRPRVLLADDHEALLNEIVVLLQADFDVVGTARDGAALLHVAARVNADVVITDFKMPGITGIEASSMLLQRGLCRAVVLLTMFADLQLANGARKAGILGFVLKVKAAEDLIPAIHCALRGETYISSF